MSNDIRVGVFLCQCGGQISNVLSNSRIERAIKKISEVAFVSIADFPCSKTGLRQLRSAIQEHHLNRVVIAGCSPRLMKQVFSKATAEAGLNPHLLEMANVRDHCARVHEKQKSLATAKAIDMITAAIHKVTQKQPLVKLQQKVRPVVAVIGGGIAGISAALSLASRGAKVKLIEKEAQLGGLLHQINLLYPRDISASEFLKEKVRQVNDNRNIEVILGAEVKQFTGAVGNYEISYSKDAIEAKLQAGAIIFAGGAQYFYPHGLYQYGKSERVVTQLEFERMLMQNKLTARELVFIQCVGSRNEERPYCARFCCPTTFKNVLWLKRANPNLKITVIFRGLTEYIREYDEATELGVLFVRYDPKQPPEIQNNYIHVKDEKTEKEFEILFDLLVLATPLIPKPEAKTWSQMLHLPIDEYGFLVEPHIKLRPDHFAPDGIFVAGSVHWPGMLSDSISQGYTAAARAYALIQKELIEREAIVSEIDPEICRGCGRCIEECPFHAIAMIDEGAGFRHAEINEFLCKGCGMCAVVCICGAAQVKHLTDGQLEAMVAI